MILSRLAARPVVNGRTVSSQANPEQSAQPTPQGVDAPGKEVPCEDQLP